MTKTSTSAEFDPAPFRRALKRWYTNNGRHDLPWRLTRDSYAILVSEVMLQQTQVSRVLPYYHEWLARWPTFAAVAETSPAEVIRAWRGLGYNRRALNLHRLACSVVEHHGGRLPNDASALRALPGIGAYTASALRSFARQEPVAVADTNIVRVVTRVRLGAPTQKVVPSKALAAALDDLLPRRDVRDHNLSLMDLGAMVCTARAPACHECPVAPHCAWRAAGYPASAAVSKPADKFETTARFARGRIIDALRESPATTAELAAMLPKRHAARISDYLDALSRDGMVVQTDDAWALPTANGQRPTANRQPLTTDD